MFTYSKIGLLFLKYYISSVESQKGVIAAQRCSLRTRRALLLYKALLVLNETSLICNSALLALSWRYVFEQISILHEDHLLCITISSRYRTFLLLLLTLHCKDDCILGPWPFHHPVFPTDSYDYILPFLFPFHDFEEEKLITPNYPWSHPLATSFKYPLHLDFPLPITSFCIGALISIIIIKSHYIASQPQGLLENGCKMALLYTHLGSICPLIFKHPNKTSKCHSKPQVFFFLFCMLLQNKDRLLNFNSKKKKESWEFSSNCL